jgi:hypothetical protein
MQDPYGAPYTAQLVRDYQRISTLIVHDPAGPNTPAVTFWQTPEEAISAWEQTVAAIPTYVQDFLGHRWYGWDFGAVVQTLNMAFDTPTKVQDINYFILGLDQPDFVRIFPESPRKQGFNSLSEKPRRK